MESIKLINAEDIINKLNKIMDDMVQSRNTNINEMNYIKAHDAKTIYNFCEYLIAHIHGLPSTDYKHYTLQQHSVVDKSVINYYPTGTFEMQLLKQLLKSGLDVFKEDFKVEKLEKDEYASYEYIGTLNIYTPDKSKCNTVVIPRKRED